ncbi:putative 2-oxoglutarate-dependent dioxygenase AOP1 [Senna tora]|uniref:Putative 2-oxoglutarate-dependent dioxygenase AOP1 n=1 Tax=Senna tora TaxID=362788 RepID=A0A834SI97_9FABA|nr:putative 2-oxoglutarate-dependent dioxygenase AOP1 [Senna tora]
MGCETKWELAVIDMSSEEMKAGSEAWISGCKTVRKAFEDEGGFVALYDKPGGEQLGDSFYSSMKQLFELPLESKQRETTDKPIIPYARGHPDIPLYETLAIYNPISKQHCEHYANVMWPQGNPTFCENVNSYAKQLVELDNMVKRMLFESFGVEKNKYEELMESMEYVVRGYKYRAPEREKGEGNLGLPPHSDPSFITILNQKIDGLEVRLKNGEWAHVSASHNLFFVMCGHAMKVWSNDRLRACHHRVFVNSKVDRYSMGLMTYINKVIEPEETLVDEEHPLRFKPFDHYGYLRYFHTPEAIAKLPRRIYAYCGI